MAIEIKHLSKSFGDQVVLDDLSITIQKGDVLAIIGNSGAGKSTFLRSINYLESPDQGEISLGDLEVDLANAKKSDILALRKRTAMVFQHFNLFERRTAKENVMEGLIQVQKLAPSEAARIAEQELAKVGLSDRMDYYPKFLSGGQKQRVGLARALAMKPELLLLDEPTSALDPELVDEVQTAIMQAAKKGQTMILVSHEMRFVQEVASHVIFLEKGKIIEAGRIDQVCQSPDCPRIGAFFQKASR